MGKGKLIPTAKMEKATANYRARTPKGHVEDAASSSN